MSFSLDIGKFAKKTKTSIEYAARNIKIDLFSVIIKDTVVDTGRLRGNWQTSTGSPIMTEIDREDKFDQHSDGGGALRDAQTIPKGDTVDYLTNNLPYAEKLEERDGMIATNLIRINRIVKETIHDKT